MSNNVFHGVFESPFSTADNGGGRAFDARVLAWEAAVIANGGSVSLSRRIIIDQLIFDLEACGAYALIDDFSIRAGENAPQALTSIKQRRLATPVNSPLFTANRGYTYDAITNYLATGFIPSSHAGVMTGSDPHLGVYLRTDIANVSSSSVIGARNNAAQNFTLRPRGTGGAANATVYALNCGSTATVPVVTTRRLTSVERFGAGPTFKIYIDGVLVDTGSPASTSTSLVTLEVYEGAYNSGSTPGFYSGECAFSYVGAAFQSDAMHAAFWTAVQTCLTSIGAAV
jgi:hypothetical protein